MKSIKEVSEELNADLQRYLESTYHLSNPRLLKERRQLMNEGETATEPWVEATPSYETGNNLRDLGLPTPVVDLLKELEGHDLDVFDPPYKHQADALQAFFNDEQDLIVSTGTGSGKTEVFLYSILGQLALESERNESTQQRGMRTLVLYPMNALVADQLSRMRLLFGDLDGADTLKERMGRRVQFGMYTSRTPYHGEYDVDKNSQRLTPIINRYRDLREEQPDLYEQLAAKGRIPAKDLDGFRNFGASRDTQFRTQPADSELFTRQEMHSPNEYGGTPDTLITNYSMLEYMLLRPIEQPLFEDTREWLAMDEANELTIVLDEAHLYRGAQGAEVALLMNRLLQKLGIDRDRVRFILTSATMGDNIEEAAPKFAANLTTGDPDEFALITGDQVSYADGTPAGERTAELLRRIEYSLDPAKIRNLASERGWDTLQAEAPEGIRSYLGDQLQADPLFKQAHEALREEPQPLSELATSLFYDVGDDLAAEATGNLLYLCTEAREGEQAALLPTRLHMFLKGLPAQYACVNPECEGRRATDEENLLGKIHANPHTTCPACGSRVFELISHRTCGAAYLRAYCMSDDSHREGATFLWTDPENSNDLDEVHLLVEEPRTDRDPQHDHGRSLAETTPSRKLDINSGHLLDASYAAGGDDETQIDVWIPTEDRPGDEAPWSWTRCPACGIQEQWRYGSTKIEDLVTKGEEPFANIVRSMFGIQPEDPLKSELPNKGRKVLCFSDGRQKAARLARDLQANVELDSFREVVADIISEYDGELSMDELWAEFVVYCDNENIVFFDDSDEYATANHVIYGGSRTRFQEIRGQLDEIVDRYQLDDIEEIPSHPVARTEFADRPRQFDELLLRSLGDEYYSIPAALIGVLSPQEALLDTLDEMNDSLDRELLRAILLESIWHACQERAYDESIGLYQRRGSETYSDITEQSAGVPYSELIPEYIRETVDAAVGEEAWQMLQKTLLQTDPTLFEPAGNGNYMVNPGATTLELQVDEDWYRCTGCRQFSVASLTGSCPREGCGGELTAVSNDDIHLQARKDFIRQPPREVAHGRKDPFTLRSEEHSAQLSAKDFSEPFSKSEIYELLFQDILVGDTEADQPIDVLSCTTTMEVGIDIGSLTGVAMRTVPPAPENYEQRAGRAGRRGAGLSTIVTFADNSPHESHYFEHPEEMISSDGTEPIIYSGNEKIAQRHINASLLARFFDPSKVASSADVFRSLGTAAEFFAGGGDFDFNAFESWVQQSVLPDDSDVVAELGALLPTELGVDRAADWREVFIRETAATFLDDLRALQDRGNWTADEEDPGDDLLATLLDDALLPTFSFPTDVCDFVVRELEDGQPKTKYEMSRDLTQALSTYVPGREIVVDKKTYESYGLHFRFADNPVNRAAGVDWGDLEWLNWCERCETVYDEQDENLEEQNQTCSVCQEEVLSSVQMYTPEAFAPEVDEDGRPEQSEGYNEERVYATPPKYPLTPTSEEKDAGTEMPDAKSFGPSTVGRLRDEQLLVANFGPDEEGFDVCKLCGAVGKSGELSESHNRPYPKDPRHLQDHDWPDQCPGDTVETSFSHTFPSDLTVFRVPLEDPLKFVPDAEWFETSAQSLAEALVMGASRALGIEDQELEGGFRTRSADFASDASTRGFVEVFLFDTTAGGAGFSSKVWDAFEEVLAETRNILSGCACDSACHNCLRRYQNRHLHGNLNRHQGLALLDYAESGDAPTLTPSKIEGLVQQLERDLQLQEPSVSITNAGEPDQWTASMNGSSLTFGVRSSLRQARDSEIPALDKDYSEYQLSQGLPDVAHTILNELQ